jgi:hypothetical protein
LEPTTQKVSQYPEPDWFVEQVQEMRTRLDAMLKLAKSHGVDLSVVYPVRKTRLTLKEATYQVLRDSEEPLHITEILKRLEEVGVPAGGRRPANTLHATLSQDRRLKRVGVNTWTLDPDYEPETPDEGAAPAPQEAERSQ